MAEYELKISKPVGDIKVSHLNGGTINRNSVIIESDKGSVSLDFSYNTLVAVDNFVSQNEWGVTTGKFLNELQPDKSKRVPHSEVVRMASERLKQVVC